jgi:hypothetical protein
MAGVGGSKVARRGALCASESGAKSRENVSSRSSIRGFRAIRGAKLIFGAGATVGMAALSAAFVTRTVLPGWAHIRHAPANPMKATEATPKPVKERMSRDRGRRSNANRE